VATMLAAMPQEHERALGGWQAEWETLPALALLTADASTAIAVALASLEVDEDRMRVNLDAAFGVARAEGLVAALAPHVGRAEAARLVEDACRHAATSGRRLQDVAAEDTSIRGQLAPDAIITALDPVALTASARELVRQALHRRRDARGPDHG